MGYPRWPANCFEVSIRMRFNKSQVDKMAAARSVYLGDSLDKEKHAKISMDNPDYRFPDKMSPCHQTPLINFKAGLFVRPSRPAPLGHISSVPGCSPQIDPLPVITAAIPDLCLHAMRSFLTLITWLCNYKKDSAVEEACRVEKAAR